MLLQWMIWFVHEDTMLIHDEQSSTQFLPMESMGKSLKCPSISQHSFGE